jgi:hypothetical protein
MNRWRTLLPEEQLGRTTHQVGMPSALGGAPQALPPARALVIEERPDGFFLLRYASDGEFAGDTWHIDFGSAKDQAAYEYGDGLQWAEVSPTDIDTVGWLRGTTGGQSS